MAARAVVALAAVAVLVRGATLTLPVGPEAELRCDVEAGGTLLGCAASAVAGLDDAAIHFPQCASAGRKFSS